MVPPMGSPTEHQESMFEDPTGFAAADEYEASEEPSYEPAEDFSESLAEPALEAGSYHAEVREAIEPEAPKPHPAPPSAPVAAAESAPASGLTIDDFAALEERILRAVSLVRSERQARTAAEERVAALEAQLQAQGPAIERLQHEIHSLRIERDQVRQRVERLLGQLDALEL